LVGDLLGRAVIIAMFLSASGLIQFFLPNLLATLVDVISQALLISYYCFEYKTAAASMNTPTGLALFEK
jgi:uncharacterized membrane-anchored protein YitT (DUF2179 family)